ncbi:MAG: hypothetical protein AABX83_00895 [Nanoarchaeota archaeon]
MKSSELSHIISAIVILAIVSSFSFAVKQQWVELPKILIFSTLIISLSILAKKLTAYSLDSDIEHEIWQTHHLPNLLPPYRRLKNPFKAGAIIPIILSVISLGFIKFTPILTYETKALKYRAAKRHGFYSFTEMTDFHNALIGASGIIITLLLAIVSYFFQPISYLSKIAIYYSFWNLLPISKLDGAQIFFGNRILWTILATITTLFVILSIVII